MKIYSDNAVSANDLIAVQKSVDQTVQSAVDAMDQKQNRQIRQLRWVIGVSGVVYLLSAVAIIVQINDLLSFLR